MNKVWLITGANGGFGRAIAEAAVAAGDFAVATARRVAALDDLAAAHPGQVDVLPLDVTDSAAIDATVQDVIDRHGRIDVLVNNAGRTHVGAAEETTDAELRDLFEVHVFGPFALTRAVLPHMRSRRSGAIVQISSMGGQMSFAGFAAYSATKFALEGMSEALADEVRPLGHQSADRRAGGLPHRLVRQSQRQRAHPDYAGTVGRTRQMVEDRRRHPARRPGQGCGRHPHRPRRPQYPAASAVGRRRRRRHPQPPRQHPRRPPHLGQARPRHPDRRLACSARPLRAQKGSPCPRCALASPSSRAGRVTTKPQRSAPPVTPKTSTSITWPWETAFLTAVSACDADPLVLLSAGSAVTRRLRLLTLLLVAPYYPALVLANQAATFDVISGGRLILGVAPAGTRKSSTRSVHRPGSAAPAPTTTSPPPRPCGRSGPPISTGRSRHCAARASAFPRSPPEGRRSGSAAIATPPCSPRAALRRRLVRHRRHRRRTHRRTTPPARTRRRHGECRAPHARLGGIPDAAGHRRGSAGTGTASSAAPRLTAASVVDDLGSGLRRGGAHRLHAVAADRGRAHGEGDGLDRSRGYSAPPLKFRRQR